MYLRQSLIATAVTMALVACGGGGDGTAPAGTPTGTTTPSPLVPAPAGTPTGTTTPSPLAPDFPNLQACITNSWVMGAEQLLRGLVTLGGSVNFTATGSQTVVFSAGATYRNTYADFTVNFTSSSTSGTSKYAGTAAGTWSVDGDRLTLTQTSSSATVVTTIAGVSSTTPIPVGTPSTVKVISCTPATLTYDQTLSSGTVVRIVLVSA